MIWSVTSPLESWRALELSVRMWPRSHLSVDLRELGWRTDCWLRSRKPSPSTRWPQCIPPGVGTRWESLPGLRRAKTSAMHLRGTEVVITVRYHFFRP